jgi:hypothetical protein
MPFHYLKRISDVLPNMHVTDLGDLGRLFRWSSGPPASMRM